MSEAAAGPQITRVRHELRRRNLTVLSVGRPAPQMVRVVLGGSELAGFTSLGFDDHVKLFFPADKVPGATDTAGAAGTLEGWMRRVMHHAMHGGHGASDAGTSGPGGAPEGWVMRDFTPRHHDPDRGELWIDFFLHEAGPASAWAAQVKEGQLLTVGGPRGSAVIGIEDIDLHVLIGDETALPAIQRRLAELPPGTKARVLVEIDPGPAWPAPSSRTEVETHWVPRDAAAAVPAREMTAALERLSFPPDRCFFWVAGESHWARAIRRHLVEERGVGKRWIKAAGYWQRGVVGAHERIEEE